MNRDGREERLPLAPAAYNWPRLSPDGTRLAVHITESGNTDVWISDVARGTLSKLTTDAANDSYPLWARDGRPSRSGRTGMGWASTARPPTAEVRYNGTRRQMVSP